MQKGKYRMVSLTREAGRLLDLLAPALAQALGAQPKINGMIEMGLKLLAEKYQVPDPGDQTPDPETRT